MDATQIINDSILESDEEVNEEENENKRGQPLAKLCILKNKHIPESDVPLFLGDNVLGRDPDICTVPLPSPSISKQHATISISVLRRRGCLSEVDMEVLIWDLGSMNGTRKGRFKLTPNVRYALSEGDSLVLADIPCQYISCVTHTQTQGVLETPVSRTSELKSKLLNSPVEKGSDTSTDNKKHDIGSTELRDSPPDVEDTTKKPVGTSCLSFVQTPTQSQGTLVPESDSDSCADSERRGGRRRKIGASDSDSYKYSPTCSTFLSPSNIFVPESEDESPITPAISSNGRSQKHVSFNKEKPERDVGQFQLSLISNDSEGEEGREEDGAASGGRKSAESGRDQQATPAVPVTLSANQQADQTSKIAVNYMDSDEDEDDASAVLSQRTHTANSAPRQQRDFYLDSDTDVDEDDALDKVTKSVPSSGETSSKFKPSKPGSGLQAEAVAMDSDTDVDEEKGYGTIPRCSEKDEIPSRFKSVVSAPVPVTPHRLHLDSDTDDEIIPVPCQNTQTADSALSMQQKDFHLDSDTDVDEEEDKLGTISTCDKKDEAPTTFIIEPIKRDSAPAASHSLHPDNDTDDAALPTPGMRQPPVLSADTGAELDFLSNGESAAKDDCPQVVPCAGTTPAFHPAAASEVLQSESDADTDVDESSRPAVHRGGLADPLVDSPQVEKVDFCSPQENQMPNLRREDTPGLLVPLLQTCSTPVHLSDDQEDEDWVVAETQSFVRQTRDCQDDPAVDQTIDATQAFFLETSTDEVERSSRGRSLQLGLSDSRHVQGQLQVKATDSTQTFVSAQITPPYAAIPVEDGTLSEIYANLEAAQGYGANEGHACCSETSEKESQGDLAQEATQSYISEPGCDSDDETDEDETTNVATAETQLLEFAASSALAFAETQPMSAFEEEESSDAENPVSSMQVKSRLQTQIRDIKVHGRPEQRYLGETQLISGSEESDKEDSNPGARKSEEEEAQTFTNSVLSAVETQPMDASEHGESDEEDSIPGPRKARQLHFEDEQTQSLTMSEVSLGEDRKSDDEELIIGLQKRNAKPLQIQDKEEPFSNSEAATETLPLEEGICLQPDGRNGEQSKDGTSEITVSKRRVTRAQLRTKEEQAKCSEAPKRQAKDQDLQTSTSRFGEGESEEVVKLSQTKHVRGKRSITRKKDKEDKESDSHKLAANVSLKEEGRLQEDGDFTEKEKRGSNAREREQGERHCQKEGQGDLEREGKEEERKHLENAELLRLEQERANEGKEQRRLDTEANEKKDRESVKTEKPQKQVKETQSQVQQEKREEEESKSKGPVRSRRPARRTAAERGLAPSTDDDDDDVPARRTRSRSNSLNSVNSERSAPGVPDSRGRGRGRGVKRTGEPSPTAITRRSNRRRTGVTEAVEESSGGDSLQGLPLRSNSSLSADVSNVGAQRRGRGGRHNARGRKANTIPPVAGETDQDSAPKPTARGRAGRRTAESSRKDPPESSEDKPGSQQASSTRGRWRADASDAEAEEKSSTQEEGCASKEVIPPKRGFSTRGQRAQEPAAAPVRPAGSDGDECKEKRKGRKRELEENMEEASTSRSKISRPQEKAQTTAAAEEDAKGGAEDVIPVHRRGRRPSGQRLTIARSSQSVVQVKEESVVVEEVVVKKRGRCQPSVVEEKQKESPSRSASRKRRAPVDSSPVAKTLRASPAARGRIKSASQTYKVLFTGVVDEDGEKVLADLGGSMAKGVADMNCLVTDKVRRTVKFLCAVAKGVPIVTTAWLEESGVAGSFLPPDAFLVKDQEQEKKFSFRLQESLRMASSQPLLLGYEIHVTKSVKPEPPQMKEILTCSGATFLSKMPSSNKPRTVVISCEEDLQLCGPAFSASLPVVTAEFILTGILQQKLDLQTYSLSALTNKPQPAGGRGRGRGRKKT